MVSYTDASFGTNEKILPLSLDEGGTPAQTHAPNHEREQHGPHHRKLGGRPVQQRRRKGTSVSLRVRCRRTESDRAGARLQGRPSNALFRFSASSERRFSALGRSWAFFAYLIKMITRLSRSWCGLIDISLVLENRSAYFCSAGWHRRVPASTAIFASRAISGLLPFWTRVKTTLQYTCKIETRSRPGRLTC